MKSKAPRGRTGLPWHDRVQKILEYLILFLTALYVFYRFESSTTLFLNWPGRFSKNLLLAIWLVAIARLVYVGPKKLACWLALGAMAMYQLVYRSNSYTAMLFLCAVMVGLAGIDYRRALKAHLAAAAAVLLFAVGGALTGATKNLVYFRDTLRSSWGICYTSDFSTYFLFSLITLWVVWEKAPDWVMLPISLISVCLALFITHSRNSLICSLLFAAVIGWHWLEQAVLLRRGPRAVILGVNALLTASYALAFGLSWMLLFLYSRNIPLLYRLNTLLTDRLRLGLEGYRRYGLTPFGSAMKMVGSGFSTLTRDGYNYVDMSFVLIPLRYGVVTLIAYGAGWTWTVVRAIRNGHRRLALAMGVIVLHSIVEQHLANLSACLLIVMPLASYAADPAPEGGKRSKRAGAKRGDGKGIFAASAAALAVLALAAVLLVPGLLSRLRTVFEYKGWRGGGAKAVPVVLTLASLALIAAAAGRALYLLARSAIARRRLHAGALAALAVCVAAGFGGHLWLEKQIDGAAAQYAGVLDADDAALRCALSAAKGRVYAGALPELYMRRYPQISNTLLPLDDLPRHPGSTALSPLGGERHTFMQCGFNYARISEEHGLYTDDPAVADALAAAGFDVRDYYYTPRQVNLETEMKKSSATMGEHGRLLDGPKRALNHGPGFDLYAGSYEARFSLLLPEEGFALAPDAQLCTLGVYVNSSSVPLAQTPVYRQQFDESGALTVALAFASQDAHKLEFRAESPADIQLWVTDISYQMLGH